MPEKTFPDQRTNRADTPIRVCDKCSANMTLLSDLPNFNYHAAAKDFSLLRLQQCRKRGSLTSPLVVAT
jgi:hypothetical protein